MGCCLFGGINNFFDFWLFLYEKKDVIIFLFIWYFDVKIDDNFSLKESF